MVDTALCLRWAVDFVERFDVRDDRLLTPGQTCWRVQRADQFACVIDAADYFKHVQSESDPLPSRQGSPESEIVDLQSHWRRCRSVSSGLPHPPPNSPTKVQRLGELVHA